jgi:hypothetical protein
MTTKEAITALSDKQEKIDRLRNQIKAAEDNLQYAEKTNPSEIAAIDEMKRELNRLIETPVIEKRLLTAQEKKKIAEDDEIERREYYRNWRARNAEFKKVTPGSGDQLTIPRTEHVRPDLGAEADMIEYQKEER